MHRIASHPHRSTIPRPAHSPIQRRSMCAERACSSSVRAATGFGGRSGRIWRFLSGDVLPPPQPRATPRCRGMCVGNSVWRTMGAALRMGRTEIRSRDEAGDPLRTPVPSLIRSSLRCCPLFALFSTAVCLQDPRRPPQGDEDQAEVGAGAAPGQGQGPGGGAAQGRLVVDRHGRAQARQRRGWRLQGARGHARVVSGHWNTMSCDCWVRCCDGSFARSVLTTICFGFVFLFRFDSKYDFDT